MKKNLFIYAAVLLAGSKTFAADPVIVVKTVSSVTVNGNQAGTVVDVLANNASLPNVRARLLDAWLSYEQTLKSGLASEKLAFTAEATAQIKKAADESKAREKQAIDNATSKTAEAQAKQNAAEARLDDSDKRLASLIAGLEGMTNVPAIVRADLEAEKTRRKLIDTESRRAALEGAKQDLERQLAELPAKK